MTRLDQLCVLKGIAESRTKSKNLILEGRISVNGKTVKKPSELFSDDCEIKAVYPENNYVSRGALKLEHALLKFGINVTNAVAADIGASTGGFTEVLLKNGASKVYAVDVGKGQLHPRIKGCKKVVSMESVNARELTKHSFHEDIDITVMDVSFISQTLIYPAVSRFLKKGGFFVSLVKPQFEVGRGNIGKGGIVKNEKLYTFVEEKIKRESAVFGLELLEFIPSPIEGGDGNKEFLAYFINKGEAKGESSN